MEHFGMLSAVLMERAALAAVEEMVCHLPDSHSRILIACGTGNNGGDGLAMARLFHLRGYPVTVLFPGKEEKCSTEAARQLQIARAYGIRIEKELPAEDYDAVADALFGIGLDREIGGIYAPLIRQLNELDAFKVAVDIASGISANDGAVMGIAFRADLTVTFGFAKIGQLLYPGASYTGDLQVKDIGIDAHSLLDIAPKTAVCEKSDLRQLPERKDYSNKGSYGKLLLFAGSVNMAGAAYFSAGAAYRMGTGLVKIVTDAANREILQTLLPEAILAVYDADTDMEQFVSEQLAWADAVIAGPGIGRTAVAEDLVEAVLRQVEVPCLLDADALNILSEHPGWLRESAESGRAEFIVTPHLGEMSRLAHCEISEIQGDLLGTARRFAKEYNVTAVLKDARTVTAMPDGRAWINLTGNHGMATGGSGDVLSGVIGALLAQKAKPDQAAPLGVMMHGIAGDAAAKRVGKASMTASDLIEGICEVICV